MKTWQSRIKGGSSSLFEDFTSSVHQDQRLAPYDVMVSVAHARALSRASVIKPDEAEQLVSALTEIGEEIRSGSFTWRDELEDVHSHVEARLQEKVGDLGGALHAGRSRNDQIAADLRLYVKDASLSALGAILALQHAFLELGRRYQDALIPSYTHLQQAQPVLIAQPLLAHVSMLGRDWERLRDGLARTDRSPLGSGAVAGSGYPLDRAFLAQQAGFSTVIENATDAVSDRDFLVEFVSCCALCMTHLSRFAEDLILWSTQEFGFVKLPDAFASGSSMMPQKKNPDVAELVRGKAALVIGDLTGILSLIKSLPLAYNRDLQEDKTPLFHAADTLLAALEICTAMVAELEFDPQRTEASISSFSLATDLADYLVSKGMPFRRAHSTVAELVAECLERGRALTDLSAVELETASPLFSAMPRPTSRTSVKRKQTAGSTGPEQIEAQLQAALQLLTDREAETKRLSPAQ
jgi:argininosuccinate lyase